MPSNLDSNIIRRFFLPYNNISNVPHGLSVNQLPSMNTFAQNYYYTIALSKRKNNIISYLRIDGPLYVKMEKSPSHLNALCKIWLKSLLHAFLKLDVSKFLQRILLFRFYFSFIKSLSTQKYSSSKKFG